MRINLERRTEILASLCELTVEDIVCLRRGLEHDLGMAQETRRKFLRDELEGLEKHLRRENEVTGSDETGQPACGNPRPHAGHNGFAVGGTDPAQKPWCTGVNAEGSGPAWEKPEPPIGGLSGGSCRVR